MLKWLYFSGQLKYHAGKAELLVKDPGVILCDEEDWQSSGFLCVDWQFTETAEQDGKMFHGHRLFSPHSISKFNPFSNTFVPNECWRMATGFWCRYLLVQQLRSIFQRNVNTKEIIDFLECHLLCCIGTKKMYSERSVTWRLGLQESIECSIQLCLHLTGRTSPRHSRSQSFRTPHSQVCQGQGLAIYARSLGNPLITSSKSSEKFPVSCWASKSSFWVLCWFLCSYVVVIALQCLNNISLDEIASLLQKIVVAVFALNSCLRSQQLITHPLANWSSKANPKPWLFQHSTGNWIHIGITIIWLLHSDFSTCFLLQKSLRLSERLLWKVSCCKWRKNCASFRQICWCLAFRMWEKA